MKARTKKWIGSLLLVIWPMQMIAEQSKVPSHVTIQPQNLNRRPSSEYFSTNPNARLLVPLNIWGEVREPGVHYVPLQSNVAQSVSAAGGPTVFASVPYVTVIRGGERVRIHLYDEGRSYEIQEFDTIVIDRSFKADLPLIFSAISSMVSIATVFVLANRDR